jgi:EAL domain-containing protein (putative c-di-GMP-specific phosphodiesterase class I)
MEGRPEIATREAGIVAYGARHHGGQILASLEGRSLPDSTAGLLVVFILVLCWNLGLHIGGQQAGNWFYIPILYAAMRFGPRGAAGTALLATVLAGPLLPGDVDRALSQDAQVWLTRGAFFLVIGQIAAVLAQRRRALEERLEPYERVAQDRRAQVGRIRRIIDEDRLEVYFQPIVELETRRVAGMESLSRFPLEEEQRPDWWFRQAWAVGVGPDFEISAVRKAVDLGWGLPKTVYQSINLSPEVLLSDAFNELIDALPWTRLTVEITEHVEIDDYRRLARPLAEIRARGAQFAVDDVGAGFASLRHVLSLSPDIIKLDVSLCRGLELSRARVALTRGLVACAEELGAMVVAEGIESADDVVALQEAGVRYGQGYLFGRPAPIERRRVIRVPDLAPRP